VSDGGHEWWEDAIVYEVYPRSFADADGDGVGDLPGLRSRLGYLADLGVDAVWLTPFYPSPLADGGYDVSDYCAVDPLLGTMADFDAHRPGRGTGPARGHLGAAPVPLPAHREVLLTSGPLTGGGLPPDTAAWLCT
jgi:hypothetical protein